MQTLIVGSSRGLGLELVQACLERGDRVAALYQHSSQPMTALAQRYGSQLEVYRADVRHEAQVAAAAERARADFADGFDRFVYNAAIHLERDRGDLLETSIEDVAATLDVNTVGAVRACKHLRPLLKPTACLVLISSEAGSIGRCWRESEYGYCMSKAALNMFARLLERRERQRGTKVDVRAVHPGWLRTDMGGPNADDSPREAALQLLAWLDAPPAESLYTDRHGEVLPW